MPFRVRVNHEKAASLETNIRDGLKLSQSRCFGAAVAYVSTYGANFLKATLRDLNISDVRLITDIRDGVTHPNALRIARSQNWKVRVVNRAHTFHSKLYLGGLHFDKRNVLVDPRMIIVGSSNLTRNGLNLNIECNFVAAGTKPVPNFGKAFGKLWAFGSDLTEAGLDAYEEYFEFRNKFRVVQDLLTLEVSDAGPGTKGTRQRTFSAMSGRVATAAWAGLESSTGERRFQPEFPRRVGDMVARMIVSAGANADTFEALCDDGVPRVMKYTYYDANSMYRLNVPNEVPGVEEARANRKGAVRLEILRGEKHPIRVSIRLAQSDIREMVDRSRALGTLGETSTRYYGWY